jgi:hypothetical protein
MEEYDTAGNRVFRPPIFCTCHLTAGCEKCNPDIFSKEKQASQKEYYPFLED